MTTSSSTGSSTGSSTDLEAAVRDAIVSVAPDVEADLAAIDPEIDAFEELQLDSMDHLNVVTALARTTGVEIPEADYPALRSVAALVRYLAGRTAGS